MIRSIGLKRAIDVENRTVEFVISSEAMDRHRTIIKSDGWRFDNYRNNPVVLYGHKSQSDNPDMVLGIGRVWQEDGKTIGEVTFEEPEINPLAEKVFRKIQNGSLNATSVGFDPINYGFGKKDIEGEDPKNFYFREQDLLEFSIVPIPSNPEALKRSDDEIEKLKYNCRVSENSEGRMKWLKASLELLRIR